MHAAERNRAIPSGSGAACLIRVSLDSSHHSDPSSSLFQLIHATATSATACGMATYLTL